MTKEARRGDMRGRKAGGFSSLWMLVLLLGLVVLATIAAARSGALGPLTGKVLLGVAIPLFFGMSLAAVGRDSRGRPEGPSHRPLPVEDGFAEESDGQPAPEVEQVYRWRRLRLRRLGVPRESTKLLAADLAFSVQELERLLGAGCPLETALRILQPD